MAFSHGYKGKNQEKKTRRLEWFHEFCMLLLKEQYFNSSMSECIFLIIYKNCVLVQKIKIKEDIP